MLAVRTAAALSRLVSLCVVRAARPRLPLTGSPPWPWQVGSLQGAPPVSPVPASPSQTSQILNPLRAGRGSRAHSVGGGNFQPSEGDFLRQHWGKGQMRRWLPGQNWVLRKKQNPRFRAAGRVAWRAVCSSGALAASLPGVGPAAARAGDAGD